MKNLMRNLKKIVRILARTLLFLGATGVPVCNAVLNVSFDKKSPKNLAVWIREGCPCESQPRSQEPDPAEAVRIQPLDNPQLIVWGIGEQGLPARGAQFYQQNVLQPLRERFGSDYRCFFYDLSAWRGLRDKSVDLRTHQFCTNQSLQTQNTSTITALPSCSFFQWLTEQTDSAPDQQTVLQLRKSLARPCLWQLSKTLLKSGKIKENGHKLQETPLANSTIFNADLLQENTAAAYSALQYLEALYLTQKIVQQNIGLGNYSMDILFLLPQDKKSNELDYYNPENPTQFQQDLQAILPVKCFTRAITTNVYFKSFVCENDKRPYIRYRTGKTQEPEAVLDKATLNELIAAENKKTTSQTEENL